MINHKEFLKNSQRSRRDCDGGFYRATVLLSDLLVSTRIAVSQSHNSLRLGSFRER